MSLTLEEVQMVINQNVKDPTLKAAILKDAQEVEADKKAEKDETKGPKAKNKLTVFIRCAPENEKLLRESAAFILKSPEEVPDDKLTGLIKESAIAQNRVAKKKGKIFKWSEWFLYIKGKNRKEQKIVNTTKEPVQVIPLITEEINFE
jgi:hypothetical protein